MTQEQAERVMEAAKDAGLYSLVYFAIMTGVRQGEQLALRWSDVDLDNGVALISRSLAGTTKSGRARAIALSPSVVRGLRQEARWGGADGSSDGPVFPDPNGSPWMPQTLLRRFHAALARAGLPRIRWHDLRHMHASLMIATGADVQTVATQMGHSSPAITLNVYSHVFRGHQDKAVRALDAVFQKGGVS